MKIITVKRAIGSLPIGSPISIYCSDAKGDAKLILEEGDSVLCKKCCEIKAGEERTFNIEFNDAELFAVLETNGDKQILGKCSAENSAEKLILEQKSKDKLSDLPKYEFSEHKKKKGLFSKLSGSGKALIAIFAAILVIGMLIGGVMISDYYKVRSREPRRFDFDGISITVAESFIVDVHERELHTALYTPDSCVLISVERFEDYPELEHMSTVDYCEGIKSRNWNTTSVVRVEDGLTYFIYESKDYLGDTHRYHLYAYKTEDSFWVVQFGSPIEKADYWEPCYRDWAKSVEFK